MRKQLFRRLLCAVFVASILTCQVLAIGSSASSAVLVEQGSGRVLYEKDAHTPRLIASTTKIMTALVALEEGDLRQRYTVTAEDMAEGSSMYLRPGEELELEELLYGLMLASGNDAALAVAHCVSGSVEDFVALMNGKAAELGLTNTSFENPNGLDGEHHLSSAYDMARLTACAMENGDFRRIVSTASITIGERYLTNHNKLLRLCEGCVGVKTGYTRAAGRTLVSAVEREGMTLICVTLNDGDDWNDHMALYDWGYDGFSMEKAAQSGQVLGSVTVTGGTVAVVPAVLSADLSCPVKEGEGMTVEVCLPQSVSAPVVPGQVLGTAAALVDGVEMARCELVAAAPSALRQEEPQLSLWERLFH